jgi:transglutaminase-like putative cysteine protease
VGLASSTSLRRNGLPQVNPGTIVLLILAAIGAAWAAGLFRPHYEDGRLTLRVLRAGRVLATFDFRNTGLLLVLALLMGWAVAAAVERSGSGWGVPGTDGRLVPALAMTTALGWIFIVAGFSRLAYLIASLAAAILSLLLLTPSPLTSPRVSVAALLKWLQALPDQTTLLLLIGLILMFALTGLWTSWWIFRRRGGLVALLPTGTILAVEIINDVSPALVFLTVVWLATAASVLLRLNFVALKEGWRTRRVPHAADIGWTFGEVGIEAIIAILAIAFLILPPLSSTDISGVLIPGVAHADAFHPFGIGTGNGSQSGSTGSVGYSETVRPGSQLTAKSKTVMMVSGDSPTFYPYWRGIALAGWNGIQWYELPSTQDVPVRQQPLLNAHETLPRDDLPPIQKIQVLHNTFHVLVPPEQMLNTVFSGGEIMSVDNQPTRVRGIMTSVRTPLNGPNPALVNVIGDSTPTASFDTVDKIVFAKRLQAPYTYTVTEAIPNVDVQDLQAAGTDYPAWLAPYTTLYQDGRIADTGRDKEILNLADKIVSSAGATTPYDKAKAIEAWFIEKGRFSYTLTPPKAAAGVRPIDNFLFNTQRGFCQDFSTAMNVMLRMLGIPSRQMAGFSAGVLDDKTRQHFVNAIEAHSWVEVFFPGYGWIPFEPTPDGTNAPINRPQTPDQLVAAAPVPSDAGSKITPNESAGAAPTSGGSGGGVFPNIWRPVLIVAVGLLLLLVIAILLAYRWLRVARDPPRIWRRLVFLGDRLKIPRHVGDTPEEFGGRLADSLPPLDEEVRRLATLYTRASFRQGGLTVDELAEARHAWSRVRGSYPRLVAKAWRDALGQGHTIRAEDAASGSRAPSRRR